MEAPGPFRLKVESDSKDLIEQIKANVAANTNLRRVQKGAWHGRKLAVCGGAPSLKCSIDELREWDGDIWGINYTAGWLCKQGIRAVMLALDPREWNPLPERTHALLASACSPKLFERLRGMDVQAFDLLETHEDGVAGGVTTATRAPSLAFTLMGYKDISFFGCDGSRPWQGQTHVDRHEPSECEVVVRAGEDYVASLEMMMQSEQLSILIRTFPMVFKNRSSGLLKAMLENFDTWEVVGVSAALKKHLEEMNGQSGLYDRPYERKAA